MLLALVLIVAVVASLGFYMGWFHFSSGSDGNSAHITVSMDKDKAVEKVQDLGQQGKDKVETTTQKAQE